MNVSLTTELENFIHSKVEAGRFQNASEVVRTAVRTMMEIEDENQQKLQLLRKRLDDLWENRHNAKLYTPEEVKAHIAERRKKWESGEI